MQRSLFAAETSKVISVEGASLRYVSNWLVQSEADALLSELRELRGWKQDYIHLFGKTHPLPRLHRWFAESTQRYVWSGIVMAPEPFPVRLRAVLRRLRSESGHAFNTALGNLYRNGADGVSWHSDDEPELGPEPTIASLSLGTPRRFLLRSRNVPHTTVELTLEHGSLLWMSGTTQERWEHCLPKARRVQGDRINVTFRTILPDTRNSP